MTRDRLAPFGVGSPGPHGLQGACEVSADLLRQAAALMRERAEAALGDRWHVDPASHDFDPYHGGPHVRYTSSERNYSCSIAYGVWPENVPHIASWHPAVALAVARWLEAESHEPETDHGDGITSGGPRLEAIFVATAYLGSAS